MIALWPLFTKKMVLNVKLRQIIANIDFLCIFQQKENFGGNLTSGCHGNALVGLMSNSTNLAKITLLVSIETWSRDNSEKNYKLKRGPFKLHLT